ncbi:hypothetical protein LMH87_006839 [Akanthomyces muscarius]|uniref:Zinc finger, FYVE domain containing protein n=1 Tax=Akanthomyces muscarius TaxID=2231603 RepID=A0A9W8QRX9_AKAMU|nr:hypothetical protein LMH87_006839 [Akanthomyces muscarius]KAJ4165197.1 hypothetical protein LMH87_006839 [Akanthomyces muscarius]
MAEDVGKSLLERLQALQGGPGGTRSSQAPLKLNIDVIERAKTPSKEDALTARLRFLREGSATPEPGGQRASPKPAGPPARVLSEKQGSVVAPSASLREGDGKADDIEHVFETDDDTLEELLADVTPDEELGAVGTHEPSDEQVKALLEKLADEIPKDTDSPSGHKEGDSQELDSDDDSDSEAMKRKVNDVVEQYQDEAELEAPSDKQSSEAEDFQDSHDEATHDDGEPDAADLGLPSVPSDLQDLPSSPGAGAKQGKPDLEEMTARIAALRAASHNTDGGGDDGDDGGGSLGLPDVPTSRPSTKPVQRLQTRTKYTDDDVDSWCTVCLEDATLRCLGCDDDVYCARCWREMHMGPAAAFDDRSHRAVQFTRDRKKKEAPRKVALGA